MLDQGPGSIEWFDNIMRDLYPVCRSLTGEGNRETLARISQEVSLSVVEVPSGSSAFDWTVPPEWRLRRAVLTAPDGSVVADSAISNLHVVGYSEPFEGLVSLEALQAHLHSSPEQPEVIPYRTSYWRRTWGFCLPHADRLGLAEGDYHVAIDCDLFEGSLSFGEIYLPGEVEEEFVFTTHICHPSLANDNLTGIAVTTALAQWVKTQPRRMSYRFLFLPATIGPLVWLSRAGGRSLNSIRAGLVLTGLGSPEPLRYKRSRRSNSDFDALMCHVAASTEPWSPYGYDERQFCAPGFDLPFGRLFRGAHGGYSQYHCSADDLDFVDSAQLLTSLAFLKRVVYVMESGLRPRNIKPHGEPFLSRHGLFRHTGGTLDRRAKEHAYLWLLSLLDGAHNLLDVQTASGISLETLVAGVNSLVDAGLLARQ